MTQLRVGSVVAWVPWSHAAFARARAEQKPVLLSLTAAWSAACRDMDRQCYDDAAIAAEINRWFIPIRVDADRRPDIAERYELGGLPTTAFLTEDGEVLGGGTFVPPERMIEALRQASRARPARPAVSPKLAQVQASEGGRLSGQDLLIEIFSTFDPEHGGFGTMPKFPLAAPLHLALEIFRETRSEPMAEYVTRTLDGMAFEGLYDEQDGGFFRCARGPGWDEPEPEKLLAANAALLKLYLEAGVTLGHQAWLARAADTLVFIRRSVPDTNVSTDTAAARASAMLMAFQVLGDDEIRRVALESLEDAVLAGYRPGFGVGHHPGGARGLLVDQVAMAAANLDAFDLTGDPVYQMMARELVEFMMRALRVGDSFVDRVVAMDDVGRLLEPLTPFAINCDAAVVLHRLSRATDEAEYARVAAAVLDALQPSAAGHGPLAAHYVLARRALSR